MTDEQELRASSDLMLRMLERVAGLEQEKRNHPVGSERFAALAWDVAEAARTVVRWSELQLRQANQALAQGAPAPAAPALKDVPARRLDQVLAEWRQAEIRLSQAPPGSQEAEAAHADAERLRLEYRDLQERKLAEGG